MFNITPAVEQSWSDSDRPKATHADIAQIESVVGASLPASYVEFVTCYGFVIFGDDEERTCVFRYMLPASGQQDYHKHEIAFLYESSRALKVWRNMVGADPACPTSSMLPSGVFPIGSDPGQGLILLELTTGRILFWRESDSFWGTGSNMQLGILSENFKDFINSLQPGPL